MGRRDAWSKPAGGALQPAKARRGAAPHKELETPAPGVGEAQL